MSERNSIFPRCRKLVHKYYVICLSHHINTYENLSKYLVDFFNTKSEEKPTSKKQSVKDSVTPGQFSVISISETMQQV